MSTKCYVELVEHANKVVSKWISQAGAVSESNSLLSVRHPSHQQFPLTDGMTPMSASSVHPSLFLSYFSEHETV
jgi:hypothetical protein